MTVRCFMLITGDIIISELADENHTKGVKLDFPAHLIHQRNNNGPLGFMLTPWVPNELLQPTPITLGFDKVMAVMDASDAMVRFYKNWALAEKDKMKTFVSVFEKQISVIEKQYLDRIANVKEQQQKCPMSADSTLTDAMAEIFDDLENDWGDPTVTH